VLNSNKRYYSTVRKINSRRKRRKLLIKYLFLFLVQVV